jgi:glutaredoxin-like YruB-family protein
MSDKKVVIYSTPTCPYCKRAKHYLDQKGISYVEHNVAEDKKAAQEMMRKTKQMSVPVIVIDDDEIVVGFDQALLDKLLSE